MHETLNLRVMFDVEEHVRYLGGSDVELATSYAHAALFVCPSLYEGAPMRRRA